MSAAAGADGLRLLRREVRNAMRDLQAAGCELVTVARYACPSVRHHPLDRRGKPQEFVELAAQADEIGPAGVLSCPVLRSSCRAGHRERHALDRRVAS